jgi:hypothetical protein
MGEAIKKFGWKRNDLVISTKVCCIVACHSGPSAHAFPRFTGVAPSARGRSTTPACHGNTSSRAWRCASRDCSSAMST